MRELVEVHNNRNEPAAFDDGRESEYCDELRGWSHIDRIECEDTEEKNRVDEQGGDDGKCNNTREQFFGDGLEWVEDLFCLECGIQRGFDDSAEACEDVENEDRVPP